ncbi:MAG: hypothetical protein HY811_10600 [Planctomycetes bacterium]|nr:hypothetical protein [Planctomycetota bacterium]
MRRRIFPYLVILFFLIVVITAVNIHIVSVRLVTKERVQETLKNLTGLPVTIERVKFHWFSGIDIYGISLATLQNEPILKARRIKITYDTGKLLKGELVFENILIDTPEMAVSQEKLTSFRFKAPRSSPGKKIPTLTIRNGKINFAHPALLTAGYSHAFDNLVLNVYPVTGSQYIIDGSTDAGVFGQWLINGEFDTISKGINLVFFTRELNINEASPQKLAPNLKTAWERYQPIGKINAGVNISYHPDKNSSPRFNIMVESLDTNVAFFKFPYNVYNIKGKLEFNESGMVIERLSGNNGAAKITMEGKSTGLARDDGYELRISVQGLPLDDQLAKTLPEPLKKIWDGLKPDGMIDFTTLITRAPGENQNTMYQAKITCHKCSATPTSFPYPLTEIEGEIEYAHDKTTLNSISAKRNKSAVNLKGTFYNTNPKKGPIDVIIEGKDIELSDYVLKDAMEKLLPGSKHFWEAQQPEGIADAVITIKNPEKFAEIYDLNVGLNCKGVKFNYGTAPFVFKNASGQVDFIQNKEYPRGRLKIDKLAAENEKSQLEISGDVIDPASLMTPSSNAPYTLKLEARNFNITPAAKDIFPVEVIESCKSLNFTGDLDISADIQKNNPKSKNITPSETRIDYHLTANISNGAFTTGIPFTEISGKLIIDGHKIGEKQHYSLGSINLSQVKISDKRFENVSMTFSHQDNRIMATKIQGTAYQGSVTGSLNISLPDFNYSGKFNVNGLDLTDFSRNTFPNNAEVIGKTALELEINGTGSAPETIGGHGVLTISEAQLWDVPPLFAIFSTFKFTKKSKFERGEVKFRIKDRKFQLDRIKFTSPEVFLRGKGTMDFNWILDVQVDIEERKTGFIPLDFVKNLIKIFSRPIYTIKIEGPFGDPKVYLKPLPILSKD